MIITVDLDDDSEVLRAAVEEIGAVLNRRAAIAEAEALAEQANTIWEDATGRQDGDAWVQPTGAHDAYRLGAVVTHAGESWASLVPANVWEPGMGVIALWERDEPVVEFPEWVQPTGSHDAYNTGDGVTFEGARFRSRIDGNTWSPAAYPAGWEPVTE